MSDFLYGVGRLALMLVVLVGLAWMLVSGHLGRIELEKNTERERLNAIVQKSNAPVQQSDQSLNEPIVDYDYLIEHLEEQLLQDARAADAEIAELIRERRAAIQWPDLLVPISVNSRKQNQIDDDNLRFRLRELDAYRNLTTDVGAARDAGEAFVEAFIRSAAGHRIGKNGPTLASLGNTAVSAGSRDPLLRSYFAWVKFHVQGDQNGAHEIWREVIDELPGTKYPMIVQFHSSFFYYDAVRTDDFSDHEKLWKQTVVVAVRWLEEESAHPEWLGPVCRRVLSLLEPAPIHDRGNLLAKLMQSKTVDPYIVHLLVGERFRKLAWHRRGFAMASELSRDQESSFAKYLELASRHFQYAWKLHPELPHAQFQLIGVAMGGYVATERPYFWFLQTIESQLDFYDAYSSFLMSLLPRWGGSRDKMLAFGSNCLKTNRFQTFIPYMAIEVLESLISWEDESIEENPKSLQLLRDLVKARSEFRAANPDVTLWERGGSYGARLLVLLECCNLIDAAVDEARIAGNDFSWTTLRKRGRPGRFLTSQLIVAQAEIRDRVLAFDQKLRQPWTTNIAVDEIPNLFEECIALKDLFPSNDLVRENYFRHVDVILEQLKVFSDGDWVQLPISSGLIGWEPYCDSWSVRDDGSVELSGRMANSPLICLRPLANFHPPLEIEAKVELLDPGPYVQNVGIGWSREGMSDATDWLANQPIFGLSARRIAIYPSKVLERHDSAWTGTTYGSSSSANLPLSSTGMHHLQLKLWQDFAEYRIDDRTWMKLAIPQGLHPEGWLCFGRCSPMASQGDRDANRGSMRWKDLKVRRLSIDPVPHAYEKLERRNSYWENRCKRDPDDVFASAGLCEIRFEQNRYDDVMNIADQVLEKTPKINGFRRWKAMVLADSRRDYLSALKELELARSEYRSDPDVDSRYAEIRAAIPDSSIRNGKVAKSTGQYSVKNTNRKHAHSLAALAAAHAELNEFDDAVSVQKEAMILANESEKLEWDSRLSIYESRNPLRLPGHSETGRP